MFKIINFFNLILLLIPLFAFELEHARYKRQEDVIPETYPQFEVKPGIVYEHPTESLDEGGICPPGLDLKDHVCKGIPLSH